MLNLLENDCVMHLFQYNCLNANIFPLSFEALFQCRILKLLSFLTILCHNSSISRASEGSKNNNGSRDSCSLE